MARELVGLGWAVEVYASPPQEDVGRDEHGVTWLPHWAYGTLDVDSGGGGEHVFVAWRFAEALAIGVDASRRYLWLHDEIQDTTMPAAAMPLVRKGGGGVLVLSEFHRSQLPPHAQPHAILTANGLEAAVRAGAPPTAKAVCEQRRDRL